MLGWPRSKTLLALSIVCVAPCVSAGEFQVRDVGAGVLVLDGGRVQGVVAGRSCEVFAVFTSGGKRNLVQVARCRVTAVEARTARAAIWDQQGSVSSGYVVHVEAPASASASASATVSAAAKAPRAKPLDKTAGRPGPSIAPAPSSAEVSALRPEPAPTERDERPAAGAASPRIPVQALSTHADFHAVARRAIDGDPTLSDQVFGVTLRGAGFDVGSHNDLLSLADLVWPIPFPGAWHTCFARPEPAACAFDVRDDDPVSIRVDAAGYRRLRTAFHRKDVEIELVFRVVGARSIGIPAFQDDECVSEHAPFERSDEAYALTIAVVGGNLRSTKDGQSHLLMRRYEEGGGGFEVRYADPGRGAR